MVVFILLFTRLAAVEEQNKNLKLDKTAMMVERAAVSTQ